MKPLTATISASSRSLSKFARNKRPSLVKIKKLLKIYIKGLSHLVRPKKTGKYQKTISNTAKTINETV